MKLPGGFPYHCTNCKHLRLTGLPTCAAYPTGIPFDIYHSENSHLTPQAGDHGIQYEPDDDMLVNLQAVGFVAESEPERIAA